MIEFWNIKTIRGAITLEENSCEEIENATCLLLNEILKKNRLKKEHIVHCIFSLTKDIDKAYPAKFAREKLNFDDVPMLCVQEAFIDGALKMCLRVLIVARNVNSGVCHVYLKGAKILRKDLN